MEERVADYVREKILSGQYPRGSRLKQVVIAQEMQLSINPVKAALRVLEV